MYKIEKKKGLTTSFKKKMHEDERLNALVRIQHEHSKVTIRSRHEVNLTPVHFHFKNVASIQMKNASLEVGVVLSRAIHCAWDAPEDFAVI